MMSKPIIPLQHVTDAYALLRRLGATEKLLRHVSLVGEAAELLIEKLRELGVSYDEQFVRLGMALHDAGKILHPHELTAAGNQHEPDGERLLLAHGVEARLARVCLSHARWSTMDCTLEELLVALADTLWKGKRNERLEMFVIVSVTQQSDKDRWELFTELDTCFENIAAAGADRLARS